MNNSSHPNSALKPKSAEAIRDSVGRAEKDGRLSKAQLNLVFEQQWFRMLVPSAYGGVQMQLPEAIRMVEALSWADGSVGWVVASNAGAGWLSAFLDAPHTQKIFEDSKAIVAGSTDVSGTAEKTAEGYVISGNWKNVYGAHEAGTLAVHCRLVKDGQPQRDSITNELITVAFLLTKDEVTVTAMPSPIGLVGASYHHIEVKKLHVAADRGIKAGEPARIDAALYKFPYVQLMEALLASSIAGMAIHFIDLCESAFAEQRNRTGQPLGEDRTVAEMLAKQINLIDDARTKLAYAIDLSWQTSRNSRQIKPAILYKISAAAYELTEQARKSVDLLFPFCGAAGVERTSEINRVWRDLHTAGQNQLLVIGSLPE